VRLDDASPDPFWLDRPRPAEAPPLEGSVEADLAIVGGGFTGLWAALQAKQERPEHEVVLLEAETAGWGASGRNGGFVDASLTHGLPNGAARFAQELDALEALGRENLEGLKADLARHPPTHRVLAEHLLETFPALEGIGVTHAWGGPIDTCSRFCVTFGRALGGRAVYVVGYTGLGVGASRFGARTALDLLDGVDTERTRLKLVRTRPVPFPPEPARWAVIQATRRALARADEHGGRRGPWLRLLDRVGLGFDS
jgi:glycine/D-amino acid oxidase-like deaminating enzyme